MALQIIIKKTLLRLSRKVRYLQNKQPSGFLMKTGKWSKCLKL